EIGCVALCLAYEQCLVALHAARTGGKEAQFDIGAFEQLLRQRMNRRQAGQYHGARFRCLRCRYGSGKHQAQGGEQALHSRASRNPGRMARRITDNTKKAAATSTMAPPEGTGISHCIGTRMPTMQHRVEMAIVTQTKLRRLRQRLRAVAAGISSSASTSTAPTIFTQATVRMVTSRMNTYSIACTLTPRTWASCGFRLASSMRL